MRRRAFLVFLLILAMAGGLRVVRLETLPPALFRDEAEKAYTAWSLASTGRDLHGRFLPLFINAFGVTTSAIYQYAAVPFMALLGPEVRSARLPAACAGTATVALVWLLVRRERGREAALWSAGFLALSPWHLVFSRWAQQGIFLPLLLTGAMLGWNAFLRGRRHGLPVAGTLFAAALYAYDPARAFVPLLGLWLVVLYHRELRRRWPETLAGAAAFLLAASPLLQLFFQSSEAAQARFRVISIFGDSPSPATAAVRFLTNYAAHWSPGFLLLHGDRELRHSAGVGLLSAAEAVALVCGIVVLVRRRRRRDLVWLGWLAAAPVAASLTREGVPHALRSIVALPAVQIVAGIGAASLVRQAARLRPLTLPVARRLMALLVIVSFLPFARAYYGKGYADRAAFSWQYGVEQALQLLRPDNGIPPDVPIVFSKITGAEYLVAYYEKIPPEHIQRQGYSGTRFRFPAFQVPIEELYGQYPGPAAFVTLPMFGGPEGGRAIPIRPPSGRATESVAVVYLNRPLADHLVQSGRIR